MALTTLFYPVTAKNGSLQLTANILEINQGAIKSALLTDKGERVLNNTYGTDTDVLKLLPSLPETLNSLESSLDTSISEYPDIATKVYGSMADEGRVDVTILFSDDPSNAPERLNIRL